MKKGWWAKAWSRVGKDLGVEVDLVEAVTASSRGSWAQGRSGCRGQGGICLRPRMDGGLSNADHLN